MALYTKWQLQCVRDPDDYTGESEIVDNVEWIQLKFPRGGAAGRELERAQQIDPQVTHVVECVYRPTVTANHRFKRGQRILNIQSVVNVGEANRTLRITAIESWSDG